jgi:Holliday junction resolvase RusA-like endonuclease
LARRIATGQGARDVELDELRQQLRDSEENAEGLESDLDNLKSEVEDAINKLHALIDDHSPSEDLEDEIYTLANRLESRL